MGTALRSIRVFAAVGLLLAAALIGGAWLAPWLLDWNRFRPEIAALASDTLGRTVRIDGPIALTLLPQPMLVAEKVAVGQAGATITARELRLRVTLGSLLLGHVDARELVLRGVDMRVPWPPPPDALVLRAPYWLSSLSARIEQGRLEIGGLVFSAIDATLATSEATGSYMVAGTAQLSGQSWRFTARLSQPGGDGSVGLDASLDGLGKVQGVGAALSGQLVGDGSFMGRISGRGPDLSQLVPAPAAPFKAEGRISVAGGLAAADELTVELGGSPARGAVSLRVSPMPRLDLALTASRLDLDAWVAALLHGGGGLPALPVGIDLSAEAAQLAGGTLRGLRGAFDIADGAIEVRELRASLPGEAGIKAAGRLSAGASGATSLASTRFDGYAALSAPSLRTTLAWLQGAGLGMVGQLPAGGLHSANVAGHVVIEPGQIAIDGLGGSIDETGVSGGLTVRPWGRPGARPMVAAGMTIERVELDALLPDAMPPLADIPRLLGGFDLDVRLQARQAVLQGVTIAPLSLDGAVEGGRVTLRKFDAIAEGVHAAAAGTLGEGGRIGEGTLDVQVPAGRLAGSPLLGMLPDAVARLIGSGSALWRSGANLQVQAAGMPASLALKVTGDLGDLRLEASPMLDLAAGKWAGSLTLRHPGAPRFAEALGMLSAASWLGDGSLSLVAQLSGAGGRLAADSFDLTAGTLHAAGALALQRTERGSSVTGRVSAEVLPLPLPYLRSPDPLPISGLPGWEGSVKLAAGRVLLGQSPALEQATGTLVLANGLVRIEGLTGRLGGGAVSLTLGLDGRTEPPAWTLTGQISDAVLSGPLFDLPLDLTAGVVSGSATLRAAGHSPAALLATLTGEMSLTVRDGSLAGVGLARMNGSLRDAEVVAGMNGGSTPFDRLAVTAGLDHGDVRMDGTRLEGPAGGIVFAGVIDLPGAMADLRLSVSPAVPEPPSIGLWLTGPFDEMRRTPELAGLILWHGEHPTP